MKLLFRCEYCTFIGVEEEVKAHEETCEKNYNKKDCFTCCTHRDDVSLTRITCNAGKELPSNTFMSNCENYKWDEELVPNVSFSNMFGHPNLFQQDIIDQILL